MLRQASPAYACHSYRKLAALMRTHTTAFSVVPKGTPWPSGDYFDLALFTVTEAQIESLLGLELSHGEEQGLGPWAAIGIRLKSGEVIELIYYRYSPTQGLVVRADLGCEPSVVIADVVELLRIERNVISWISPRVLG